MNQESPKFKLANVITRAMKPLSKYERYLLWYALCSFPVGATEVVISKRQFKSDLDIETAANTDALITKAIRDLVKNTVVVIPADVSPTGNKVACAVVYWCEEKEDQIELKRLPEMVQLMDEIRTDSTWYFLNQLAKLDGTYAPKIYQMAKMRLSQSKRKKVDFVWHLETTSSNPYESLKKWLDIESIPSYKKFAKIEEKILLPAIREINTKCSDCHIHYDSSENKKGDYNKIESIVLHISSIKPPTDYISAPIEMKYWYENVPEFKLINVQERTELSRRIETRIKSNHLFKSSPDEAKEFKVKKGLFRYAIFSLLHAISNDKHIRYKTKYLCGIIDKLFDTMENKDFLYSDHEEEEAHKLLWNLMDNCDKSSTYFKMACKLNK